MSIELSAQDEMRLREVAAQQGLPAEELIMRAVKQLIPLENEDAIRARMGLERREHHVGDRRTRLPRLADGGSRNQGWTLGNTSLHDSIAVGPLFVH